MKTKAEMMMVKQKMLDMFKKGKFTKSKSKGK